MSTIVVVEVQTTKVEELQSGKEIEASQQTNGPTTKRTKPVIEYLNPTAAGLKPLPDQLPDSGEVEEDELQQNKVEEQDSLKEKDTDMHHHCCDR